MDMAGLVWVSSKEKKLAYKDLLKKAQSNSIKSLTWAKDRGLNSLALGLSVDFLTCLNVKNKKKLSWAIILLQECL